MFSKQSGVGKPQVAPLRGSEGQRVEGGLRPGEAEARRNPTSQAGSVWPSSKERGYKAPGAGVAGATRAGKGGEKHLLGTCYPMPAFSHLLI